jgi:hypothetical protein
MASEFETLRHEDVIALLKELHRRLDVQAAMLQTIVEVQQSIERLLVKVYDPARAPSTPFDVGPSQ